MPRKSYKKRSLKSRTKRAGQSKKHREEPKKSHIVKVFIEMLNVIKLYHWKTHSYAEHKATDDLYDKLNSHIDEFIEVLLGKDQSRIKLLERRINLVDAHNTKEVKSRIHEYREFLADMNIYFDVKRDSDLLSIRDDILADLNQFLYLLSFTK